jgi:DNA polymerase III subunit gamma/tau
VEDGRARLDAGQIRELMGTVPNAVFERILEAVDGNRSAEVITVANQLLDAGNSPAQLARQFVRYLRNTVIAKIAGIGVDGAGAEGVAGELLQISADEQRRAGRSAALFSEEELTRFLQVMLKTFDELGYRQEQRFHFELGLLKLVHLRRLLPIEAVLSQFPVAGGERPGPGVATARTASTASSVPPRNPVSGAATARVLETSATVASSRPAFSPFEKDQSRSRFDEKTVAAAPIAVPVIPVAAPVVPIAAPMPVPAPVPMPVSVATPAEMVLTDGDAKGAALVELGDLAETAVATLQAVAQTESAENVSSSNVQPGSLHSAEELQRVAVDALLAAKNQATPADALADAEWIVTEGEIQVQTELSKTMLPLVINAEVEKLVKTALREANAGALKLILLPGVKNAASTKKPRAVKSGSVQAKAMEHPIVQRAQTLFNAEIRNVIDLRDND